MNLQDLSTEKSDNEKSNITEQIQELKNERLTYKQLEELNEKLAAFKKKMVDVEMCTYFKRVSMKDLFPNHEEQDADLVLALINGQVYYTIINEPPELRRVPMNPKLKALSVAGFAASAFGSAALLGEQLPTKVLMKGFSGFMTPVVSQVSWLPRLIIPGTLYVGAHFLDEYLESYGVRTTLLVGAAGFAAYRKGFKILSTGKKIGDIVPDLSWMKKCCCWGRKQPQEKKQSEGGIQEENPDAAMIEMETLVIGEANSISAEPPKNIKEEKKQSEGGIQEENPDAVIIEIETLVSDEANSISAEPPKNKKEEKKNLILHSFQLIPAEGQDPVQTEISFRLEHDKKKGNVIAVLQVGEKTYEDVIGDTKNDDDDDDDEEDIVQSRDVDSSEKDPSKTTSIEDAEGGTNIGETSLSADPSVIKSENKKNKNENENENKNPTWAKGVALGGSIALTTASMAFLGDGVTSGSSLKITSAGIKSLMRRMACLNSYGSLSITATSLAALGVLYPEIPLLLAISHLYKIPFAILVNMAKKGIKDLVTGKPPKDRDWYRIPVLVQYILHVCKLYNIDLPKELDIPFVDVLKKGNNKIDIELDLDQFIKKTDGHEDYDKLKALKIKLRIKVQNQTVTGRYWVDNDDNYKALYKKYVEDLKENIPEGAVLSTEEGANLPVPAAEVSSTSSPIQDELSEKLSNLQSAELDQMAETASEEEVDIQDEKSEVAKVGRVELHKAIRQQLKLAKVANEPPPAWCQGLMVGSGVVGAMASSYLTQQEPLSSVQGQIIKKTEELGEGVWTCFFVEGAGTAGKHSARFWNPTKTELITIGTAVGGLALEEVLLAYGYLPFRVAFIAWALLGDIKAKQLKGFLIDGESYYKKEKKE